VNAADLAVEVAEQIFHHIFYATLKLGALVVDRA
jgi:hypothetical protein